MKSDSNNSISAEVAAGILIGGGQIITSDLGTTYRWENGKLSFYEESSGRPWGWVDHEPTQTLDDLIKYLSKHNNNGYFSVGLNMKQI